MIKIFPKRIEQQTALLIDFTAKPPIIKEVPLEFREDYCLLDGQEVPKPSYYFLDSSGKIIPVYIRASHKNNTEIFPVKKIKVNEASIEIYADREKVKETLQKIAEYTEQFGYESFWKKWGDAIKVGAIVFAGLLICLGLWDLSGKISNVEKAIKSIKITPLVPPKVNATEKAKVKW